jgi:GntR family transcriptional regulator, transcriptional repressor for pyruvate dehydrogenase complex
MQPDITNAPASGNALIVKLIEDMRTILEEHSLVLAKVPHRRKAASVEHTSIYNAIMRRDPEAAGAAMAEHVDNAEQTLASPGQQLGTSNRTSLFQSPSNEASR